MPEARVTGMCSLDGKTAVAATTSGLMEPVSALSTVEFTAPISLRPICVTGSKRPENLQTFCVDDLRSGGNFYGSADSGDLPSLMIRVPSSMGGPARGTTFACVMA